MNKLKESTLNEATNSSSRDTTTSVTTSAITRSSDNYICGIGIVALLAADTCVLYKSSQTTKKPKKVKELVGHNFIVAQHATCKATEMR